jgi:ABC-type transporter Mla subunit MlaD
MTKMLGFFFAIILTVLIFTTIYVQRWNPFSTPQFIRAHFDKSVEGLRKGDDVRVDGIVMGKVEDLGLADKGGVIVTLAIDKPIELYRGDGRNPAKHYEIKVESISFLGGNHVSIRRGDPDTPKVDLSNMVVGSTKPSGFEQFGEVMAQNREEIRAFIANASEAFGELKKTAVAINEGKGTVGALLHERKLHDDAVAAVEQFKVAITEMREALGGIAQKLQSTETTAGKLLNTSELHDELTKTLSEVRKSVNDTTGELRALLDKAKDPNAGPVGAFLGDTALCDDL